MARSHKGKNANAVRLYTMSALAAAEIEAQRKLTGGEKYVFGISTEQTYRKHWLRYLAANGMAYTTPMSCAIRLCPLPKSSRKAL